MRSWRAFLALCTVYLLIGAGVQYGVATYPAAEVPAILVAIGDFWLEFVVWALPVPIIARAVVLTAKSLGLSGRRLLAVNVIGILALPGIWLGIAAYERWERRPASASCTAKPISLTLSGVEGSAPWSEAISLYLGPDTRKDGRYLFSPGHRRSVCWDTSDGTERLIISALSIKLDRTPPGRCVALDIQPWEKALCAKSEDRHSGFLPNKITFFNPNGIQLGDFGIPKAATNSDYPLTDDQRLVSAANAEVGTVTAVCRSQPNPNGSIYCQMRRQIIGDVSLYWEISAPYDAVGDVLLRTETFARSVCSSVFALPGCTTVIEAAP